MVAVVMVKVSRGYGGLAVASALAAEVWVPLVAAVMGGVLEEHGAVTGLAERALVLLVVVGWAGGAWVALVAAAVEMASTGHGEEAALAGEV